jgi:hypothetical protein
MAEEKAMSVRDAFLKNSLATKMAILQADVAAKAIVNENPGILISKTSIKQKVKEREAQLKESKKQATAKLKAAKNAFEQESAKPENSKATGQPLRDAIEELLKSEYGLDKGVYFGGDFQGTEVRKLMMDRHAIFSSMRALLETRKERMIVPEEKLWEILGAYEQLFGHLDAIFSICRIKRYHTTTNDINVLRQHAKQAVAVWRALGLSMTPKMHCVEDHLCDIVARFEGVGDIGEDEGERAHQTGHKNDCRNKALRDHAKRTLSNSQNEFMACEERVVEQRSRVIGESKRKRKRECDDALTSVVNAKAAKLKRDASRTALLSLPLRTEAYCSIQALRKDALSTMNLKGPV